MVICVILFANLVVCIVLLQIHQRKLYGLIIKKRNEDFLSKEVAPKEFPKNTLEWHSFVWGEAGNSDFQIKKEKVQVKVYLLATIGSTLVFLVSVFVYGISLLN